MREQVEVTFTAEEAEAVVAGLELANYAASKYIAAALGKLRAAINAPPTPEELRDAREKAAGFDRDAVEEEINKALLPFGYNFFEAHTPGQVAMEQPSFAEIGRLGAPKVRQKLADAAGFPLVEVDTCEWSFDDKCDEEAIVFTFDLDKPEGYVQSALETSRDDADTHGFSFATDGVAETAVDHYETQCGATLPTKLREEIVRRLRSGE